MFIPIGTMLTLWNEGKGGELVYKQFGRKIRNSSTRTVFLIVYLNIKTDIVTHRKMEFE